MKIDRILHVFMAFICFLGAVSAIAGHLDLFANCLGALLICFVGSIILKSK